MKSLVLSLAICACEPVSQVGAQDDAQSGTGDAPIATTCGGGNNAFVYTGAFDFQAFDFNFVTSNSQIVGIAGSATNADVVAFNTRPLAELETIGDHDVATENITALRAPFNVSCDVGNTACHGFFAHAGTYTVHAVHPRYQATFTLSSLFERTDNSSPPGAAIAGTITGCVDRANP